jgi:hypothetical protein
MNEAIEIKENEFKDGNEQKIRIKSLKECVNKRQSLIPILNCYSRPIYQ